MYRVFMSAYKVGRTEAQNRRQHGFLMQRLLLSFSGPEMVLGRYKGEPEVSITFGMFQENQHKIAGLLFEFEQECALVVDASGFAWYLFPDNRLIPLMGYLQEVQEYPADAEGYTYWRNKWWILRNDARAG